MTLLLDTNVLLRAAGQSDRLGTTAEIIAQDERLVSAATTWELAIKQSIGKLQLGMPVSRWVRRALRELDATMVAVTNEHAAAVETLPPLHRDPFDRLLVAQAREIGATLLTTDRALAAYGSAVHVV